MPRLLSAALALALALGACGGAADTRGVDAEPTLLLDFQPNAVHAGIYLAISRGYDEAEGLDLRIRRPGNSTDAPRLLRSGRVDLAILDIHDLGLALEKDADLVGVMAVVQQPLAAVLAQPGIRSPKDLEGRRVGVTGLPSDDAVLRSLVRGDGGDPEKVRSTTIGFESVKALLARRVDAATAFWNAEGVAVRRERPGIKEFRVDDFGAPAYPELVLVVSRATLEDRRDEVAAVVRALQRGYVEAAGDPPSAATAMLDELPDLDREQLSAELEAVAPAFTAGTSAYGRLDAKRLEAWADWDVEFGILERRPDVGRAFDTTLVGPISRD